MRNYKEDNLEDLNYTYKQVETYELEEDDKFEETQNTLSNLFWQLDQAEQSGDSELFKSIFEELKNKIDACCYVLERFEMKLKFWEKKENEAKQAKKVLQNKSVHLKEYMLRNLKAFGFEKFSTKERQLSLFDSEQLLINPDVIIDSTWLDTHKDSAFYVRTKVEHSWDKVQIKDSLKKNVLPEEMKAICSLVKKPNLKIKTDLQV